MSPQRSGFLPLGWRARRRPSADMEMGDIREIRDRALPLLARPVLPSVSLTTSSPLPRASWPGSEQNPVLPPGSRLRCPQPRTAGGASANTRDLTATRCRLDSRTLEPRVLWTLVVIIYCGVKDALEPEKRTHKNTHTPNRCTQTHRDVTHLHKHTRQTYIHTDTPITRDLPLIQPTLFLSHTRARAHTMR